MTAGEHYWENCLNLLGYSPPHASLVSWVPFITGAQEITFMGWSRTKPSCGGEKWFKTCSGAPPEVCGVQEWLGHTSIHSWVHGMVWVGRGLRAPPVPPLSLFVTLLK